MDTYFTLSVTQENAETLAQKSFYSFLTHYAMKCGRGYGAAQAWKMAMAWGVDALYLDQTEMAELHGYFNSLINNGEVAVKYMEKGENKMAVVRCTPQDNYPIVTAY